MREIGMRVRPQILYDIQGYASFAERHGGRQPRHSEGARFRELRGAAGRFPGMAGSNAYVLRVVAIAGLCGTLSAVAQDQKAAPRREAWTSMGTLTCSLTGPSAANSAVLEREALCRFRPGSHGADETYSGIVKGAGRANELFSSGTIIIEVKGAASITLRPGMLQQTYSADAARGSIAAAAPLTGETNNSIVLQPVDEEEGRVAEGKVRPEAMIMQVDLTLRSSPS
jgi:Protein of unknown function (DUF992)